MKQIAQMKEMQMSKSSDAKREYVRQVECPKCGAAPGEQCRNGSNQRIRLNHQERSNSRVIVRTR